MGRWLSNHLVKCPSNPININKTPTIFVKNNTKIEIKKNTKNFKPNDISFLKGFNLSVFDRNTRLELENDESMIFLDEAFNGKNFKAKTQEQNVFESSISSYLNKFRNNLRVASLNINSLEKKYNDILFILNEQLVDVLVINETKLNEKSDDSIFEHDAYETYRLDRQLSAGGGVLVYAKKNLNPSRVTFDKSSEIISFAIKIENQQIAILACYRPPYTANETNFFASIDEQLKNFEDIDSLDTLIIGDLNFNMDDHHHSKKLSDFNTTFGFTNTIHKPTRRDPISGNLSLLDVILSTSPSSCLSSNVFPYACSDHSLIVSIFNFKSSKYKYSSIPSRCLNEKKIGDIKTEIKNYFNKLNLSLIVDVDENWRLIKEGIIICLDKIAPVKQVNVRITKNLPWYDRQLVNLAHKRNKLYNSWCKTKLKSDREKYVTERNRYYSVFRAKKSNYYKDFVCENSQSTKSFWIKLNPFLNPNKKQKISASILSSKENKIHSSNDLVNAFSNYFATILNKFNFINLDCCKLFIDNFFENSSSLKNLIPNDSVKFEFGATTTVEVNSRLKKLNSKSAPGSIGIEANVFKECSDELTPIICELFNLCLKQNSIPHEWKTSHITPIYKGKGNKSSLENYRPISIISPLSKVFESVIGAKMRFYFESKNILHQDQNGFREGRSCHLALNTIIDFGKKNLDKKNHVIAVFLDLSKAFDTIDHELLLQKLDKYGFSLNALKMIENYLSNRNSIVNFNGSKSKSEILKCGVPQGSILGPLLFIIFINDLCHILTRSNKCLFADDTTLVISGKNIADLTTALESDLKSISEWLKHNRLLLNVSKSNAMIFKWRYQRQIDILNTNLDAQLKPEIKCNDEQIPFVTKFTLLGVVLDEYLTFDLHTISLCSKVNWKISVLKKSSYLFNLNFRITLFKLFIISKYDYCSTLFFHFNDIQNENRLEKNFCKALKSYLNLKITGLSLNDQFEHLKTFRLLPLKLRFFQNFVYFVFSLVKTKNKNVLSTSFESLRKTRETRAFFNQPLFDTNLYKFSFLSIAIKLLNSFIYSNVKNTEIIFRSAFEKVILTLFNTNSKHWT